MLLLNKEKIIDKIVSASIDVSDRMNFISSSYFKFITDDTSYIFDQLAEEVIYPVISCKSLPEKNQVNQGYVGRVNEEVEVDLVNRQEVNAKYGTEFKNAGNHFRHIYIPDNEIWVDCKTDRYYWPLNAFHEIIVRYMIIEYGKDLPSSDVFAEMIIDSTTNVGGDTSPGQRY